jgi:nucleotide-binding universal stress UspA family protein
MDSNASEFQSARDDFQRARQRAALQEIVARLTGKSNRLLSYDEVVEKLKLGNRSDRGVQRIPLSAIVGSVGRYTDFTRTFLPLDDEDEDRWSRVKVAATGMNSTGLSPIEVYQVGDVYFVQDGNHRVSIARQQGVNDIEAHVIELRTRIPFTTDTDPDDLILKAEYAVFLEETRLDELLPEADLTLTVPGQYARLQEHIQVHRYFMGLDLKRDILYEEAVKDWYETVYLPIATATRERGLLRWFPNRTEADLYLWVSEHRADLEKELGWTIRPEAAVTDLAVRENKRAGSGEVQPGSWRQSRLYDRYTEHLFKDVLVPVSGHPDGWNAFDQAVLLAHREGAQLHGLHLVAAEQKTDSPGARAVQAEFRQRCEAAGVAGSLLVEEGEIASKICARALLTDLVVMNTVHPPAGGLAGWASGLRTIIWRCARPLLAVCCDVTPMDRALLAFDGSPKSREALFVAAYLAERWKTALTVVAVAEGSRVTDSVLDYARAYLELHELQADFVLANGPVSRVQAMMEERKLNLLLMGGYSVPALEQILVGSTVNVMLRQMEAPIFICR